MRARKKPGAAGDTGPLSGFELGPGHVRKRAFVSLSIPLAPPIKLRVMANMVVLKLCRLYFGGGMADLPIPLSAGKDPAGRTRFASTRDFSSAHRTRCAGPGVYFVVRVLFSDAKTPCPTSPFGGFYDDPSLTLRVSLIAQTIPRWRSGASGFLDCPRLFVDRRV